MSQEQHQSKIVDLIAIITAKPGKAERVVSRINILKIIVGRVTIGPGESRASGRAGDLSISNHAWIGFR